VAEQRPILIAGAGIGGLTLAILLARKGIPVRVFERAPVLAEVGAGLQISANASRILDGLGLGPEIDTAGVRTGDVRLLDGRADRLIGAMPLGRDAEKRWGAPYRLIHRAALQRILADAAKKDGVDIKLGAEFLDFSETGGTVRATFQTASGEEQIETPALVGADGVRSAVRTKIGGGSLTFSGHLAWRALTKFSARAEISVWFGPGGHLVTYPLDRAGTLNVVACTPGREGPQNEIHNRDRMRTIFRDWASPVRTLIDNAEFDTPWPLYEGHAKRMGVGNVTLIGDAAHPVLPHFAQGAAMAIEDALVLATGLAGSRNNFAKAFRAYEAVRAERTLAIQTVSRRNGELFRMSGLAAMARNGVMRALGPRAMMAQMDWIYGYRVE
jgi:salicylate hydroxylase